MSVPLKDYDVIIFGFCGFKELFGGSTAVAQNRILAESYIGSAAVRKRFGGVQRIPKHAHCRNKQCNNERHRDNCDFCTFFHLRPLS